MSSRTPLVHDRPTRAVLGLATAAALLVWNVVLHAPAAASCMMPDRSEQIELDLGGGKKLVVEVAYYDAIDTPDYQREAICSVAAVMTLSTFPSTDARWTTGQLADRVAAHIETPAGLECGVYAQYENDVDAHIEGFELCTSGLYVFEAGRAIETQSEQYCFSPETWAEWQQIEADVEEEVTDLAGDPADDALASWEASP